MFQKMFLFTSVLLVAAIVTPVFSQAQHYAGSGQASATGLGSHHSAYYGGARYGGNYYGSPQTYMSPRYQYFYSSPLATPVILLTTATIPITIRIAATSGRARVTTPA